MLIERNVKSILHLKQFLLTNNIFSKVHWLWIVDPGAHQTLSGIEMEADLDLKEWGRESTSCFLLTFLNNILWVSFFSTANQKFDFYITLHSNTQQKLLCIIMQHLHFHHQSCHVSTQDFFQESIWILRKFLENPERSIRISGVPLEELATTGTTTTCYFN